MKYLLITGILVFLNSYWLSAQSFKNSLLGYWKLETHESDSSIDKIIHFKNNNNIDFYDYENQIMVLKGSMKYDYSDDKIILIPSNAPQPFIIGDYYPYYKIIELTEHSLKWDYFQYSNSEEKMAVSKTETYIKFDPKE